LLTVGLVGAASLISLGIELHLSRANLTRIEQSFHPTHGLLTTGAAAGSGWFDSATARFRYLVGLEDTATGLPILGSLPAGVNQGLTVMICLVAVLGFLGLVTRRGRSAMLIGVPPILVLVASAFHRYPLVGRTLLFLLPSVALCLGEGIRVLISDTRRKAVVGGIVAVASLIAIVLLPALHVVQARAGEGVRPALRELGRHYQRGDTLYVGHFAQYGLVYYHLCGCAAFDPQRAWPFTLAGGPSRAAPAMVSQTRNLVVGSRIQSAAIDRREVRLLRGRRIWVLISQEPGTYLGFLAALSRSGRELYRFGPYGGRGTGAWLYLFDLGAPPD
jgi:hypothetical protein